MRALKRFGLALALAVAIAPPALAQARYDSAEAAADALVTAIATGDEEGLKRSLGLQFRHFVPLDSIARDDVYAFLAAWHEHHEVARTAPGRAALLVGRQDWTFPAPLVERNGRWSFDLRAGVEEMRVRRIARNEAAAIETLVALCTAQDRYRASHGRPAARIVSREGATDGLYWDAGSEPQPSPMGDEALVMTPDTPASDAWHGYHYAVTTPQNESGCAFRAWPAARGQSGERTFTIGADRTVKEARHVQ